MCRPMAMQGAAKAVRGGVIILREPHRWVALRRDR